MWDKLEDRMSRSEGASIRSPSTPIRDVMLPGRRGAERGWMAEEVRDARDAIRLLNGANTVQRAGAENFLG